jgi:predicted DNA-binding transcriptional regulator AlpA
MDLGRVLETEFGEAMSTETQVAQPEWRTFEDLAAWLEAAPPWMKVPAAEIGAQIRLLKEASGGTLPETTPAPPPAPAQSWRERIWTVHPETRLGRDEVCVALGKSRSWLYKKTAALEIPFKLDGPDGELAFRAGEIRDWLRDREVVVGKPTPRLRAV